MFKLSNLGIKYSNITLSNKVDIHFYQKNYAPIIMLIAFPIGSQSDPINKAGLLHLLEHMILKQNQLFLKAESLGGWANAYTYKQHLIFEIEILLSVSIYSINSC